MGKKSQILELRQQGYSYNKIVELTGHSKGLVAYYCNDTTKTKVAEHQRQSRAWISQYLINEKAARGCSRCGESHPATLDFHHIDPSKKSFGLSVARCYTSSLDKIKVEIAKCEVLCSNCHRKEHWAK